MTRVGLPPPLPTQPDVGAGEFVSFTVTPRALPSPSHPFMADVGRGSTGCGSEWRKWPAGGPLSPSFCCFARRTVKAADRLPAACIVPAISACESQSPARA